MNWDSADSNTKTTPLILMFALFMVIGLLCAPLHAQDEAWQQCNNPGAESRIKGCTAVIQAGKSRLEDLAVAYNNRGTAHRDTGNTELAIRDYNEAIKLHPAAVQAYFNRGNLYLAKAEYAKARQDYNEVLQITPKDARALYNRGN